MLNSKIFRHFIFIFFLLSFFLTLNYISSIGYIDKNIIYTFFTLIALLFIVPTVAVDNDYSLYILNNSANSFLSAFIAFISIFAITLLAYYIKKTYNLNDSTSLKVLYSFYAVYMLIIFFISGSRIFVP